MSQRTAFWIVLLGCALVASLFFAGVFDTAALEEPDAHTEDAATDDPMRVDGLETADGDPAVLVGRDDGDRTPRVPRGPVLVTVTNPGGHPLAGVPVVLGPSADLLSLVAECRSEVADAQGRVRFADVPYDGSMSVGLIVSNVSSRMFREMGVVHPEGMRLAGLDARLQSAVRVKAATRIQGGILALESPVGVRYDARAFDAATGRRLHSVAYKPHPRFIDHTGAACTAPLAPVPPEPGAQLALYRKAPQGYVLWSGRLAANGPSPMASRIVVHDPIPPIAGVTVSVRTDGEPVELGNETPYMAVGARGFGAQPGEPDAVGRIPLRHVPFVPHATVTVWWTLAGNRRAHGEGRFGASASEPLHIELKLLAPVVFEDVTEEVEIDADMEWIEEFGESEGADRPTPARARVRVLRPDGTPGAGASVSIGGIRRVADRKGVATFSDIAPGRHHLTVWGAGWVPQRTHDFASDQEVELDVRGSEGGRVRVTVVGADGTPLPFAWVRLHAGTRWMDEAGGSHRMDLETSGQGRRTFHMLPPGPLKLTAGYIHKISEQKTVQIVEGKTVDVEIVIPIKE
ncbi:MAG: carboxypeptidase-like regulatory domain-containing protein [Planctomycetota bacterium]|nr:carboxypeptidase-like regulatory domain-containing protein [Planctomycetota bacterium]